MRARHQVHVKVASVIDPGQLRAELFAAALVVADIGYGLCRHFRVIAVIRDMFVEELLVISPVLAIGIFAVEFAQIQVNQVLVSDDISSP